MEITKKNTKNVKRTTPQQFIYKNVRFNTPITNKTLKSHINAEVDMILE